MPKHNPDYSKTVIYKLINYDHPELVYVGSTTNFTRRKAQHKSLVSENSQHKLYKTIQEHGGWDSWHMIEICKYPCSSSADAKREEDRHMTQLKANLNTYKAYLSDEEKREQLKDICKQYRDSHKQQLKDYRKQYYDSHKQQISEKIKCECGCHISKHNITIHKKSAKHQRILSSNSSSESSSE